MKVGKLRSIWIIILCLAYSAYTCGRAIYKSMRHNITRQWCDEELQRMVKRLNRAVRIHPKIVNPHQTQPPKNKPTIIMCNHSSLFDIPLSFLAFRHHSIRMLAKKELGKIPIFGGGMVAAEFPFIDRHNRRQAFKDLDALTHLMKSGIIIWIAPEGTRSKDGKLGSFKKGGFITAINTQATIIPIGIRGAHKILPARTVQFHIDQYPEIHIGEPIDASKYTLKDKDTLLEKVRQSIEKLINDPDQ